MDSENKIEWIEQYLEGELTGDELIAFEKKMATDSSFAAEVKLQKEIAEAMAEDDVLSLSRKIRVIQHQKKRQSAGSGRIIIFRRLLQIAASVALLVAAYFVYENFNQTYTPQELAAQYFSPDENISHSIIETDRSGDPDTSVQEKSELRKNIDAIWLEIQNLYSQKKYDQALEKLYTIQTLDPSFEIQSADEFYFYQGLFLMQDDQHKSAISSFQQVKMTYTEKATWYSALSYLELGDVENAKQLLKEILSHDFYSFKESAKELMKDIEG
jgi:FimV-like protein